MKLTRRRSPPWPPRRKQVYRERQTSHRTRHPAALIIVGIVVIVVIVILSIPTTADATDRIRITTEEQEQEHEQERTFSTKRNNTKQQDSLLKRNIDTDVTITTLVQR